MACVPVHWNFRGVAAICYLITFGSLVGYSAYVYAMDRLPVSIVSLSVTVLFAGTGSLEPEMVTVLLIVPIRFFPPPRFCGPRCR